MSRTRYLFGSWKNKLDLHESLRLFTDIAEHIPTSADLIVGVCPSHLALPLLAALKRHVPLVAQNCGWEAKHALTGEISAKDLRLLGVDYCLVGHSERRLHLGESEDIIGLRLRALLHNGVTPIVCIGEGAAERDAVRRRAVLARQIETIVSARSADDACAPIIAYEPMWAISTSGDVVPPSAEIAGAVIAEIRDLLTERVGAAEAEATPVLYGGAVNVTTASAYFAQAGVDGCLVGAASQSRDSLLTLVRAARGYAPPPSAL